MKKVTIHNYTGCFCPEYYDVSITIDGREINYNDFVYVSRRRSGYNCVVWIETYFIHPSDVVEKYPWLSKSDVVSIQKYLRNKLGGHCDRCNLRRKTMDITINELVTVVIFEKEGVAVVNTTPHDITMMDTSGEVVVVPPSVLINAQTVEEAVSPIFVTTKFVGTAEGVATIAMIENSYAETGREEQLVIVGSIIAAQAYPGKVVGMTPCPGFERVAPSEKRMNCNKFTVFS